MTATTAPTPRTPLEQSLIDFAAKHRLTNVTIGHWPPSSSMPAGYEFSASVHFDDARPGEIACASESAPTLAGALAKTLAVAAAKRVSQTGDITAALPELEDA